MYVFSRPWLLVCAFTLFAAGFALPAAAAPAVEAVRFGDHPSRTRVVLDLSEKVSFTVFTLADPYRVVVDLPEVSWRLESEAAAPGRRITGYRYGLFRPGQSRVVIDLARPVAVAKAFTLPPRGDRGHRLVIDLADVSREAFLGSVNKTAAASEADDGGSAPPRPPPVRRADQNPMIVIDPGHGGVDPGARGVTGTWEKDITLLQARELRRQLLATGRYRVTLTRDRDVFVRLRQRIAKAQRAGGDLFISLHADSIDNHGVRGGSVYTLSEKSSDKEAAALAQKENKADIIAGIDLNEQSETVARILIDLRQRLTKNESVTFAKGLIGELGESTRLLRNNHRFAGFAVLKAPEIPSVLIEMGYLSNRHDERLLRQPAHRRKLAAAIVRAIDGYFARQQALMQP